MQLWASEDNGLTFASLWTRHHFSGIFQTGLLWNSGKHFQKCYPVFPRIFQGDKLRARLLYKIKMKKPRNQTTFTTQPPPTCIFGRWWRHVKSIPFWTTHMPFARIWGSLDYIFFQRSTVENFTFHRQLFFSEVPNTTEWTWIRRDALNHRRSQSRQAANFVKFWKLFWIFQSCLIEIPCILQNAKPGSIRLLLPGP